MADLNDLFHQFYSKINLSKGKKDQLRVSRDAVREKIKEYFKETIKYPIPHFHLQGSFVIGTVVNPINCEYDIDDGIYLQNLPEKIEEWPTSQIVHSWIHKAVENHTNKVCDKENCIRVVYQNQYHIDLPIYGIHNGITYLAKKRFNQNWIESDPILFTSWFNDQLNTQSKNNPEQLRRNIQYLKAWKDYKSIKFPSIAITILCCKYFDNFPERDDKSLGFSVSKIIEHIKNEGGVTKPVHPFDNVLNNLKDNQIDIILQKLEELKEDSEKAICSQDKLKDIASQLWERHLGDRFPIIKSESTTSNSKLDENIVITNSMTPKPWSSNEMV